MCTVTYLPLGNKQYVLTSSRDEHKTRPVALPPKAAANGIEDLLYPQDPQGGGTWFAANGRGATATLLNGAYEPYAPAPSYRHSRGLVPLAVLQYPTVDHFVQDYPLEALAPFTLIVAQPGQLHELRWTGKKLDHHRPDPDDPHIWSSATLYSPDAQWQRKVWLAEWLAGRYTDVADHMLSFHMQWQPDVPPPLRLRMETTSHRTVSITQRHWAEPLPRWHYQDLIDDFKLIL